MLPLELKKITTARFIKVRCFQKMAPQGLKPLAIPPFFGTTKVVP